MKGSLKNAIIVGKIGEDNNGYPIIRLSMEDKLLFEKDDEYAIHILGSVNRKKSLRGHTRIIMNTDY